MVHALVLALTLGGSLEFRASESERVPLEQGETVDDAQKRVLHELSLKTMRVFAENLTNDGTVVEEFLSTATPADLNRWRKDGGAPVRLGGPTPMALVRVTMDAESMYERILGIVRSKARKPIEKTSLFVAFAAVVSPDGKELPQATATLEYAFTEELRKLGARVVPASDELLAQARKAQQQIHQLATKAGADIALGGTVRLSGGRTLMGTSLRGFTSSATIRGYTVDNEEPVVTLSGTASAQHVNPETGIEQACKQAGLFGARRIAIRLMLDSMNQPTTVKKRTSTPKEKPRRRKRKRR